MAYLKPVEVQLALEIQTSTLRKYASALEENGYVFNRNKAGHRLYTERDLDVFERLISYKNINQKPIKENAKAVMAWINESVAESAIENESSAVGEDKDIYSMLLKTIEASMQIHEKHAEVLQRQYEQQEKLFANLMEACELITSAGKRVNETNNLQQEVLKKALDRIENSVEMVGVLKMKKLNKE